MKTCRIIDIFLTARYFGGRIPFVSFLGSLVEVLKIVASYGNAEAALGGTAAATHISSSVFEAASKAWITAGLILPGRITAFYKVKCVASSY